MYWIEKFKMRKDATLQAPGFGLRPRPTPSAAAPPNRKKRTIHLL